jgi:hypothetical protein
MLSLPRITFRAMTGGLLQALCAVRQSNEYALAVKANDNVVFMQADLGGGLPLSTLSITTPLVPSFI